MITVVKEFVYMTVILQYSTDSQLLDRKNGAIKINM
jgi:hypothetical protein